MNTEADRTEAELRPHTAAGSEKDHQHIPRRNETGHRGKSTQSAAPDDLSYTATPCARLMVSRNTCLIRLVYPLVALAICCTACTSDSRDGANLPGALPPYDFQVSKSSFQSSTSDLPLTSSTPPEAQDPPSESAGAVPAEMPTQTPSTAQPAAQDAPTAPSVPPADAVALAVPYYCFCSGLRNQLQTKMKVTVANNSASDVKIGLDNFRLLADLSGATAPWTPPDGTSGEVSQTEWSGSLYSTIPPNAHRAYEQLDQFSATWATFWDGESLGPGETYDRKDQAMKGDLVFYVPVAPDGSVRIAGLGLFDQNGQILTVAPIDGWVEHRSPSGF